MAGLFDEPAHAAQWDLDFERLLPHRQIMIDGGFCNYCFRKDGQVTIYVILSRRRGAGSEMLAQLKALKKKGAHCVFAKCPADLPSNDWYRARGFALVGEHSTKNGRLINHWRLPL